MRMEKGILFIECGPDIWYNDAIASKGGGIEEEYTSKPTGTEL